MFIKTDFKSTCGTAAVQGPNLLIRYNSNIQNIVTISKWYLVYTV